MKACYSLAAVVLAVLAEPLSGQAPGIVTFDHTVRVTSIVPALAGKTVELYVRERYSAQTKVDAIAPDRVALFVHGAGTPAEVAFDVPHSDYSWMAYLATAGFDVFAMDTTGYGRSVRPAEMSDPCNLSAEQQKQFVPSLIPSACEPKYAGQVTNLGSDWHDIDAVVDHIRRLRKVEKVSLIAWSLGGPRAGGYAAQHPEKVNRLVLFAPAYNRNAAATPPPLPNPGTVFNTQSRTEFDANWDRQLGCPNQFDPAVREVVWKEMIASDPVGAKWGTGVRRAPSTTTWGWNAAMIGGTKIPTLMIAGAHDRQVPPDRVRAAFDDLGAADKVLVDLGCASHNAMWESNHTLMFAASLEWLTKGTVNGTRNGVVRMGYPKS
ncbi:MAG TPA: alpha/beta fold hydrolase [Vicinamibacterales bacterium]|nr:alpha/beta fold hydrolase [Vicinamibacterales bacterium]